MSEQPDDVGPYVGDHDLAGDPPSDYPPFDMSAVPVDDVPASDTFSAPIADASKPRRSLFRERKARESATGTREPRTRTVRPKVPTARKGHFVAPLTQMYTGLGAMLTPFDQHCGTAIIQSAPQCAETLDELAQRNEAVRKALFALTTTSAAGMVLWAHAPILLAIVVHHVPRARDMYANMGTTIADAFANVTPDEMARRAAGQQPAHDDMPDSDA